MKTINDITKCQECGSKELHLKIESTFGTALCFNCMVKRTPELGDLCECGHIRDMHRHGDWLCSPDETNEGHARIEWLGEHIWFFCPSHCSSFKLSNRPRITTFKELIEIVMEPLIKEKEAQLNRG